MKPELEGRGGGYGRFAGKTLAEIKEIFDQCETDPSMRSVSIVLRVTREQLDARGNLGHYPVFASVAGGVLVLTVGVRGFLPASMQDSSLKFLITLSFITVALLIGVVLTHHDRRAGLAQEKAIIELARASLDKLVADAKFVAKPLDFTQDLTLKKILAGSRESPATSLLS